MRVRSVLLSAAACLLLLPAASSSAADVAGEGFKLGPVTVSPALTLSETYDDNIGLASAGHEQSDWVTALSPALQLSLPVERFLIQAGGQVSFLAYKDATANDSTDWSANGSVGADFPGGLSFELAEKYTDRFLLPSQEFGPGERSAAGTTSARAGYRIREELRAEASWVSNLFLFDRSTRRSRTESVFRGTLFWKFQPQTSALVEAAHGLYSYSSYELQDSTATALAVGLSWDPSSRSTGIVKLGWQWKSFRHEDAAAGRVNDDYYVLTGTLRHAFTSRTTGELEVSHGSQESDFPRNPYYIRSAIAAGLAQRFTYKLYGRATLRYASDSYPHETVYKNPYDPAPAVESGRRHDDLVGLTLGAGFDALRWLTFEATVGTERRTSSFATFDYRDSRVMLSAKAAF
jgi:hypothetical protein